MGLSINRNRRRVARGIVGIEFRRDGQDLDVIKMVKEPRLSIADLYCSIM